MKIIRSIGFTAFIFLSCQHVASAQVTTFRAGSESQITPSASNLCNGAVSEPGNKRAAARGDVECVFENGGWYSRVFAVTGFGTLFANVSAENRLVVAHFQVENAESALSTSYLPFQASVPASWNGVLYNQQLVTGASADINMYLRLRESDPANAFQPGPIVSQTRFQGATHGGIRSCLSVPTDKVSAATMVIGCGLAVRERDSGSTTASINGVIKANQAYTLELVVRADVMSRISLPQDLTAERVDFFTDVREDGDILPSPGGLRWENNAVISIGTDANRVVSDLQDDIDELRDELVLLRADFDSHYHTYLTGRGNGHNNTVAETPPPIIGGTGESDIDNDSATNNEPSAGTVDVTESTATPTETRSAGGGGGAIGPIALIVHFTTFLILGIWRRQRLKPLK